MSLFKVLRGSEANLPAKKTDGWAYFCTDTGSFWIDHKDENNTLVRSKISAKFADKLRYIEDGKTVELDPSEIATIDGTVKKAKQLNVSDLGNYTNKTVGELQTRINSWLEENFNVGAMFVAKGNWPTVWNNGSSAVISDGRTYTATVVSAYQNANYLQLMISTYGAKEIFFVVKEAGVWKNIVKNAFQDDIDSLQASVDGKAASSHTHDDRYYTESEINAKFDTVNTTLSGKASTTHAHDMKELEGFFIELNNKGTKGTGHGGYLDFHYDGSGADYTSRIIESASGSLSLNGVKCASSGVTCTSVNITNGATKNKTSGYVKLNNGMILQWGTVSSLANGNSKWVTFPIAFPTAVGGAPMLTGNYGNSFGYELHANDVAATGFTIVKRGGSSTTGTDTVSWLAVGW